MKKYRITDENGEQYEVEEVEEKAVDEEPIPEVHDEELLPEEIAALKKLAAAADQLIALIDVEKEEHNVESFDDEDEIENDEDVEVEEKEEQLVDTDEEEKIKGKDSKRSFGAIERKRKSVDDSLTDEISNAWAKRYGGAK